MTDVQGHCPACGSASLFLGEGGHVTCWRTACVAPGAADQLLHGEGVALATSLRSASNALISLAQQIPETLARGLDRDNYALAPSASEPPVVGTARIRLDVAAVSSATVPVPQEAFDRLVRVAMWVSRGRSMAFTPDPSDVIGKRYPDAVARAALGALKDAGLLDTYRQTAAEESPNA
ncbi:hypothetical protein OG384_04155 [Streptomyces sp. NBC_01324]|uniref:hypothetical protein n=1 Tax=Streptomyces sp. NBC_01324 TaxID=2903826 RepID=UPI002E0F4642|nr:hypothetical protein OG384_04155 [Streptomyces sp. NBC_01324]